jgi:hypothetical protein
MLKPRDDFTIVGKKFLYSILFNNRLYTPPIVGINWSLWHRFVKNLPSNDWFNYSNNGIKHYFIKENHTLYTYTVTLTTSK